MFTLGFGRKSRFSTFGRSLFLLFLVLVFSPLWATRSPERHPTKGVVLPGVSGTPSSAKEIELKKIEENRVFLLGLSIMKNFGCSDFENKSYQAFVDFLRGQAELGPRQGGRVVLSNEEHARMLTGHFTLLNNTQKTDTPSSKVQTSRTGYSKTFQALSKIINEDVYKSYGSNADLSKVAADLENPRSQYGSYFKSIIREKLKELSKYSSVDHWNVGCPGSDEVKKKSKNEIVMVSATQSSAGKKSIVSLDDYMTKEKKQRSDVLDFTLSAVSFKTPTKSQEAPTTVASRTPQSGRPVQSPSSRTTSPTLSPKPPVHNATPPKVAQKPAPAPKVVTPQQEEEKTFEERAQERLRTIPKQGTKGRGLYDRFLNWMDRRNLDSVDDFHEVVLSNLSKNPSFKQYLIDRNPFGQMCVNYKNLSIEQRERILTKSFLVHLLTENFDSNTKESFGDYNNDSVGPWQTAMNTRNYGCKFLSHDELRYNVDKNVHCLMVFYSYREHHYDKIYGRSSDPKVSGSKLKGTGLHWSVIKEGSGHAYFEEKYEPLFRSATRGECQNTYLNTSGKTTVNGHPAEAVREFLNAII